MITITINTDNDAFQDGNREAEIARILRKLATQIEAGEPMKSPRDINGNHCGNVITTGRDRDLA